MKTTFALALLAAITRPATSLTLRSENSTSVMKTSDSFMGFNLYYLQGLSDSDQDAFIGQMAADGAKVARVWVNAQNPGCQKGSKITVTVPPLESTIGKYNDKTLDALDKVIVKLSNKGIKALISPHDANSLLGDYRKSVLRPLPAWNHGGVIKTNSDSAGMFTTIPGVLDTSTRSRKRSMHTMLA